MLSYFGLFKYPEQPTVRSHLAESCKSWSNALKTADVDLEEAGWESMRSDSSVLFDTLRRLPEAEIFVSFKVGVGKGYRVDVPAASLNLRGRLKVEAAVDRFHVLIPGWGEGDFAWFSRRKGRGRSDYWQAAIEHRAAGAPALVLYLTAELDGLELRVRPTAPASSP